MWTLINIPDWSQLLTAELWRVVVREPRALIDPSVRNAAIYLHSTTGAAQGANLPSVMFCVRPPREDNRPSHSDMGHSLPLIPLPSTYYDDFNIRATERQGRHPLSIECDHRSSEPREGSLGHHASQGCLRFGQHPFGHGQGSMLPRYATSLWLTSIKDTIANEQDYVDLALFCAHVCNALERGLEGRQLDELSRSVLGAIEQLTA